MTIKEKYTPSHIANYFLLKASKERIDDMTQMKLIKLIYIAYGWNLVFNKEQQKLFEEPILAWKHGPVIPSIYHEFKRFGGDPIDDGYYSSVYEIDPENGGQVSYPIVENESPVSKILDAVWNTYKYKNGIELSRITHESGSAWDIAHKKSLNSELDDGDIKRRSKEKIDTIYQSIIKKSDNTNLGLANG